MSVAAELQADLLGGIADVARRFDDAVATGFFAIQSASPVDTHRFQGSHLLSVAESGYVEPVASSYQLRGQDHVDAVLAQLGDEDGEVGHESNVPYAELLAHHGWSSQAPAEDWMEANYEAAFAAHFPEGA